VTLKTGVMMLKHQLIFDKLHLKICTVKMNALSNQKNVATDYKQYY